MLLALLEVALDLLVLLALDLANYSFNLLEVGDLSSNSVGIMSGSRMVLS